MALIPYPNVPKAPGVPALPRSPRFPPTARAVLGVLQGTLWRALQTSAKWGIYDAAGKPLGDPNTLQAIPANLLSVLGVTPTVSTGGLDYAKETRVSDFPIEKGSFASYNKVRLPSSPNVTLCMGGSETERKAFLAAIDAACESTAFYSVVTPEATYINYSLERYNYQRRQSRGANLLIVDISLREVREVSAKYAQSAQAPIVKPKDAAATPPVDGGKVQAQAPRQSVLKSATSNFPGAAASIINAARGLVQ